LVTLVPLSPLLPLCCAYGGGSIKISLQAMPYTMSKSTNASRKLVHKLITLQKQLFQLTKTTLLVFLDLILLSVPSTHWKVSPSRTLFAGTHTAHLRPAPPTLPPLRFPVCCRLIRDRHDIEDRRKITLIEIYPCQISLSKNIYTYSHRERGEELTREKVRGAIVHKAGSKIPT
jgi:hypothetical protein